MSGRNQNSFGVPPGVSLVAVLATFALAGTIAAQEPPRTPTGLEARTIALPSRKMSVADIVRELEKQTGNRVVDRRSADKGAIEIGFDGQTFWQALDRVAEKLDARLSFYGDDGIGIVDGPRRAGTVVNSGMCRVEIKTVTVQLDLESARRTCALQLEFTWEPRYEPLYLTADRVKGTFAPDATGKQLSFDPLRGVAQQVTQRRTQTVELRVPAPERSSPALAALSGEARFLGPTRMVSATFAKLEPGGKPQQVVEDDVKVTLSSVAVNTQTWTFQLDVENPVGTPAFESFQSWIDNNRIHLEQTVAGKKVIWTPRADDWNADLAGRKAKLTYAFSGAATKGQPAQWTLVYRTPGRIVEHIVPFEFRNVALP